MDIELRLYNFENQFVAFGRLHLLEECIYEYPEIRQIFSDKILEYNWQENQDDEIAALILRDSLIEISNGIFDYSNLDNIRLLKNDKANKLFEINLLKSISEEEIDNNKNYCLISFRPDPNFFNNNIVVALAKEDGDEVR
jgi:hypothetical protein